MASYPFEPTRGIIPPTFTRLSDLIISYSFVICRNRSSMHSELLVPATCLIVYFYTSRAMSLLGISYIGFIQLPLYRLQERTCFHDFLLQTRQVQFLYIFQGMHTWLSLRFPHSGYILLYIQLLPDKLSFHQAISLVQPRSMQVDTSLHMVDIFISKNNYEGILTPEISKVNYHKKKKSTFFHVLFLYGKFCQTEFV